MSTLSSLPPSSTPKKLVFKTSAHSAHLQLREQSNLENPPNRRAKYVHKGENTQQRDKQGVQHRICLQLRTQGSRNAQGNKSWILRKDPSIFLTQAKFKTTLKSKSKFFTFYSTKGNVRLQRAGRPGPESLTRPESGPAAHSLPWGQHSSSTSCSPGSASPNLPHIIKSASSPQHLQ